MSTNITPCACETCVGAGCTCGCQEAAAALRPGCQCGESCACGANCTCGR